MASAVGWFAACTAYWAMNPSPRQRLLAAAGAVVSALLILIKVLPVVPGHFDQYEDLALGLWCALGLLLRRRPVAPVGTAGL